MDAHTCHVQADDTILLECERLWVFAALIAVGGYLGAFTFTLRGGVFCNAQTANLVLMGMAIGQGQWRRGLYYLIPIGAYFMGAVVSELMPGRLKRRQLLRWDTVLVGIEAAVVFLLGLVPDDWPFQISQITINFICSMQFNTFRQAEHIPMSTTFCTNHIRQTGVFFTKWLRHRENLENRRRLLAHLLMLLSFSVGAALSSLACRLAGAQALWGAVVLLLVVFAALAHADLTKEKDFLALKPSGH